MTVWVEQAQWMRMDVLCGHLISDDLQALHDLALKLELDRGKYFNRHALIPHYSIPEGMVPAAIEVGAVELRPGDRARVLGRVHHLMASRHWQAGERGPDALPRRRKGQQSLFDGDGACE